MHLAEKWLYGLVGGSGALLLVFFIRAIELESRGVSGGPDLELLAFPAASMIPASGLLWLFFGHKLENHKLWIIVSTPLLFVLTVVAAGVLVPVSY
ncbi:hypothetical protein HUA74_28780 [Myxococcus sp. CA051A]|uniref:hypothetical protein n=1 Tax=unclassified Myxococcus TaxID=2648731 RepID=UPI00157B41EB|nr:MULTISPECIES: hypothetical protein [unclassified Myxococcus]NTX13208.1 hypothetical protein [Myxococcus sp. CA056]NTX36341.1 hypothetical protein [Myxococcus sp. CA033]NTX53575.1 hypothetical protein [Myxococcus sp. CA039A]NTX64651.1 hypothetical protein [Myxococcus sp. CA051A]